MIFAKVVGTVVAEQKDEKLSGHKLLLCQETDAQGNFKSDSDYHVAVDAVQARVGDFVMISYGSSARMTSQTSESPIDAVIMAIIDDIQLTEE